MNAVASYRTTYKLPILITELKGKVSTFPGPASTTDGAGLNATPTEKTYPKRNRVRIFWYEPTW